MARRGSRGGASKNPLLRPQASSDEGATRLQVPKSAAPSRNSLRDAKGGKHGAKRKARK